MVFLAAALLGGGVEHSKADIRGRCRHGMTIAWLMLCAKKRPDAGDLVDSRAGLRHPSPI
jgi:hypothetical protein